jgi:hypothetical protein
MFGTILHGSAVSADTDRPNGGSAPVLVARPWFVFHKGFTPLIDSAWPLMEQVDRPSL